MALAFFLGKERAKKIIVDKESKRIGLDRLTIDYGEITQNHLLKQASKLGAAFISCEGWRQIIDDADETGCCTPNQIFHLQIKSMYLYKLYKFAIKYYDTIADFYNIAALSILEANKYLDMYDDILDDNKESLSIVSNPATVIHWFWQYRTKDCFVNTRAHSKSKDSLSSFLASNPDAVESLISYCNNNLSTLSVERVHHYIIDDLIPKLVQTIALDRGSEYTKKTFLEEHKLTKFNLSTTYRWMTKLGFSYHPRKKCYYVDSHESPENVKYRKHFIDRYFQYELRAHCWLSISKEERDKLVLEGEIDEHLGYKYELNDKQLYEFHVDDHVSFQARCDFLPYGGYLSVRMPPGSKKIMLFGQDEVIFKQHLFSDGYWMLPNGKKQLVPKDEGHGLMLSSFTCRELGYGVPLSDEDLKKVNEKRQHQTYSDAQAAIHVRGSSKKENLTSTPFVRELEYGCNHDGYWTYDHMILQFEDCIDCLKILYPDFEFIFLFDHSNGHDRLKSDGLSIAKLNMKHGRKQPKMRSSLLKPEHFGPFHTPQHFLQPGMKQSMTFMDSDQGPCYMSDDERLKFRNDVFKGELRTKNLTVAQMIDNLKGAGYFDPKGSAEKLQMQSQRLGLPTTCTEEKIIEGWCKKTKGSIQILFEQGWLNPACLKLYTADGKKEGASIDFGLDPTGSRFSINRIMQLQSNFLNEVTLLQFHAEKLGVKIDRTPKCHPELAGEGIEYLWALAKFFYRRSPIGEKRTKEKFKKSVYKSTDAESVLNISGARACSKKARSYMKLYKAFEDLPLNIEDKINNEKHSILEKKLHCIRG